MSVRCPAEAGFPALIDPFSFDSFHRSDHGSSWSRPLFRFSVILAEPRAPHFVHRERRASFHSGVSLPPYFA